jgi:hypothetical protein
VHIAIFVSFALTNVNHLALAIDIAHFQSAKFLPTQSGSVQRHQNHAMVRGTGGFDQSRDFLLAQNHRQSFGTSRINQIDLAVRSSKYLHEKKPNRRNTTHDRPDRELAIIDQMQLILSQMFLTQLVWTLAEIPRELLDGVEIWSDRAR